MQHHHDNPRWGGQWTLLFNPCNTRPINMATTAAIREVARGHDTWPAGWVSGGGGGSGGIVLALIESHWAWISFICFLAGKTFVTRAWGTSNRSSSWPDFWLTRVATVVKCWQMTVGKLVKFRWCPTRHLIRVTAHKCDSCACVCVSVCGTVWHLCMQNCYAPKMSQAYHYDLCSL